MENTRCLSPENISKSKHISFVDEGGDDVDEGEGEFFACYLLTSLCPRFKGHTYIGFTVNPCRRIRQHNGEIGCGAWRTKSKRPWEMVCCIYGFPTNFSALQFEWAWQHPIESLSVRHEAIKFKSLSGIQNKIKLAATMLNIPTWNSLNLTLNFFSTKYTKYYSSCPRLPTHMKLHVSPIEDLPCYISVNATEEYDEATRGALSVLEADGSPQAGNETSEPRDHQQYTTESSFCFNSSPPWRNRGGSEAAENEESNKKMGFGLEKEVEVINIFSPSPPDFRTVSSPSPMKEKRRKQHSSPIIIDLTQSPLFLQL